MPFYDAGDAAIYYEVEGRGSPLVLLHGYALNSLMWEFQKPAFSQNHTLVTIDLRGFGKSSCDSRWSGTLMAEDVKGIIKSLDLVNVTVLGFSMGGPVAMRLAYEMPDIVSRLILVSSILPSSGRPRSENEARYQEREIAALKLGGIALWTKTIRFNTGPLVEGMFDKNPDIAPLWERIIAGHHRDYVLCMLQARLTTTSTTDWRSRLPQIRQRTLVIAGAKDSKFIAASRHLANDMPNSRLTIIKDAGHMVNLEKPEEFNQMVLEFLREKN